MTDSSPQTTPGTTVWFGLAGPYSKAQAGLVVNDDGHLSIGAHTPRSLDGAESHEYVTLLESLNRITQLANGLRVVVPNRDEDDSDDSSPALLTRDNVVAIAREEAMKLIEAVMGVRPSSDLRGDDQFFTQVRDITREEIKKESRRAAAAFRRSLGAIPTLEDRGLSNDELPITAKLINDLKSAADLGFPLERSDSVEQGVDRLAEPGQQIEDVTAVSGSVETSSLNSLDSGLGDGQVVGDVALERESTHEASPSADGVGAHSVGDGQVAEGVQAPSAPPPPRGGSGQSSVPEEFTGDVVAVTLDVLRRVGLLPADETDGGAR